MTKDDQTISPEQCRAARSLLGWSQWSLADIARLGRSTIADFERGERTPNPESQTAIRAALEKAGVIFIEKDRVAGVGVRLRR